MEVVRRTRALFEPSMGSERRTASIAVARRFRGWVPPQSDSPAFRVYGGRHSRGEELLVVLQGAEIAL